MRKKAFIKLVLGIIILLELFSCAATKQPIELSIHSSKNANDNSPLSVDFVVIYDEKLMDIIPTLSANKWFQQKNQLKRNYPEGFQVTSWEVVPGTDLPMQMLDYKRKVIANYVFANYFSNSEHRVKLTPQQKITINLLDDNFTISGEKTVVKKQKKVKNNSIDYKTDKIIKSSYAPGFGQISSGRNIPGIAYSVAFVGALGWSVLNLTDCDTKITNYNSFYKETYLPNPNIENSQKLTDLKNDYKNAETLKYISFGVLGGVYLINLADAIFLTPDNPNEAKKVALKPAIGFDSKGKPEFGILFKWTF